MRTFGIDTSHWDGKVDWAIAKAKGVKFGIFKLTDFYKYQAKGFVDTQAANSWQGTRDNGMVNGAWCWLQPRQDPIVQAKFYLEAWNKYPTDMPPILDFEDKNVNSWNDMLWRGMTWLQYVEKETGKVPIIYTSSGFINCFDRIKRSALQKYPLWIAQYPWIYTENKKPSLPYPWVNWIMWQYNDRVDGRLYGGESSTLDVNVFPECEESMREYFKVGTLPPEPPVDYLFQALFKATALTKRDKPKTGKAVGYVLAGEVVKVYEVDPTTGWYRIDAGTWVSGNQVYWERI
jgi:lysozyme